MKLKKIILVISIIIVLFIGINVVLSKTFNKIYKNNVLYQYEFDDIKDVIINTNKAKIIVKESDNDKVKIKITGKDNKDLDIKFDKGIIINYYVRSFINSYLDVKITIETPKNNLNNVYINTNSGSVDVLDGKNINVKSKTSNIKIGEGHIITLESKYGDINIDKVTNSLFVKNEYGDVDIEDADLKCISNIYAMEGNITINKINDIEIYNKDRVDKKNYKLSLLVYSNNGTIKIGDKKYE